jgi:hypothetical protein
VSAEQVLRAEFRQASRGPCDVRFRCPSLGEQPQVSLFQPNTDSWRPAAPRPVPLHLLVYQFWCTIELFVKSRSGCCHASPVNQRA